MAAVFRAAGKSVAKQGGRHISFGLNSILCQAQGQPWGPGHSFPWQTGLSMQSLHSLSFSHLMPMPSRALTSWHQIRTDLTAHSWTAAHSQPFHQCRGGGWRAAGRGGGCGRSQGLSTLSPFAEALRTREARLEAEANALANSQADSNYFGRPQDGAPSPPVISPYVTTKPTNSSESAQLLTNETHMPVIAYHIGTRLNFYSLAQSPEFVTCPRALNRDSIILSLHARNQAIPRATNPEQYMVVFKYGSVVFFNISDPERRERLLEVCERFTESPASKPQTEEFNVIVRPSLSGWSELHPDLVVLKRMDTNSVRVISSVLGQSVALDMYASKVESSLEVFSNLNREMERTGTFTIRKEHLFRLVAQNNILITEIITKLGLLERSDTAWKFAQYGPIWEGLRAEFELETRFQTLDLKINLIQNNVKYFLEILQNRKSDTLEWIIIILIAAEIMLGLYEIFGKV